MSEITNNEFRIANAAKFAFLALILNSQFAILNSPAAVPLKWTVKTSRATPAQFEAYQGETLALEATLQSDGKPVEMSGIASLYWQTNGMGSAYWEAPAAVNSNRLSAVWTPEMDVGARVYNCFIGQPGTNYHAAFQLRLRPSPGALPNVLPLPVPVIDFARVRVLNPPWGSGGGVDTNAVEVIANKAIATNAVTVGLLASVANRYTKDETDALLSGKQADIGASADNMYVVFPYGIKALGGEVLAMWYEVIDTNAHGSLEAMGTSDDDPNAEHMHIRTFADSDRNLPSGDIVVPRKNGVMALTSDIPAPYTPPSYLRAYDEVRKCWWRGRMVNGVINWEVE